jgi:hypothetical protein
MNSTTPIDDNWLKEIGFRWHEFDRSGGKHWLLWLGSLVREREIEARPGPWAGGFMDTEDIGIELAASADGTWFCWFRSDAAGRYSRFIHIRHLRTRFDVTSLIEGIIGGAFYPQNCFYGSLHTEAAAIRIRKEQARLDRHWMETNSGKRREIEKDESRGPALPEHLQVAEDVRVKKATE